jgi:hypothetical protein
MDEKRLLKVIESIRNDSETFNMYDYTECIAAHIKNAFAEYYYIYNSNMDGIDVLKEFLGLTEERATRIYMGRFPEPYMSMAEEESQYGIAELRCPNTVIKMLEDMIKFGANNLFDIEEENNV